MRLRYLLAGSLLSYLLAGLAVYAGWRWLRGLGRLIGETL